MRITWQPPQVTPGEKRSALPSSAFAFPKERKEPLTDGRHVRSAIARFGQVTGVADGERAQAFANLKAAAEYYGVPLRVHGWRDLMDEHLIV